MVSITRDQENKKESRLNDFYIRKQHIIISKLLVNRLSIDY